MSTNGTRGDGSKGNMEPIMSSPSSCLMYYMLVALSLAVGMPALENLEPEVLCWRGT